MDAKLLDILVCPICKGELQHNKVKQELVCKTCSLIYPIQDGIPMLLEKEAHPLESGSD
jgi:uncharacterized protein YbaR (Trm112 family)